MTDNRRKLSSSQVEIISLTISIVFFICMAKIGIIFIPTENTVAVLILMISCCLGTIFINFIFYSLIFKGGERKEEEEKEEKSMLENITTLKLSNTDFRQVYLGVTDNESHINMMMEILKKEGYKLYAKFNERHHIYLVVKDKYDEEVYNAEIENHMYFNRHFKLHE